MIYGESALQTTRLILDHGEYNAEPFSSINLSGDDLTDTTDPNIVLSVTAFSSLYPPNIGTGDLMTKYYEWVSRDIMDDNPNADYQLIQLRKIVLGCRISHEAIIKMAPVFQKIQLERGNDYPLRYPPVIIEKCKAKGIPLGIFVVSKIVYCEETEHIGNNLASLHFPPFSSPATLLSMFKQFTKMTNQA